VTVRAWRIVQPCHTHDAFNGEGARTFGGRWNHIGTPMVYTAGTKSLALLEILVHAERHVLPDMYMYIPVEFDDSIMELLDPRRLPDDWQQYPAPTSTKDAGSRWANDLVSAVLQVPSAIIPSECIFLLNPKHRDFSQIRVGTPEDLKIDSRFRKS